MSRVCPLRTFLPDRQIVRAMRKGRYRSAKATTARTLYGAGLSVVEVVEAMKWPKTQVLHALRIVP